MAAGGFEHRWLRSLLSEEIAALDSRSDIFLTNICQLFHQNARLSVTHVSGGRVCVLITTQLLYAIKALRAVI